MELVQKNAIWKQWIEIYCTYVVRKTFSKSRSFSIKILSPQEKYKTHLLNFFISINASKKLFSSNIIEMVFMKCMLKRFSVLYYLTHQLNFISNISLLRLHERMKFLMKNMMKMLRKPKWEKWFFCIFENINLSIH